MKYKYLFFLEREFHISLFQTLINYIYENEIGIVKIFIHAISDQGGKLRYGANAEIIKSHFHFDVEIVADPYSYDPDFTFVADSSYEKVEGLGKIVSIGHGTICKGSFFVDNNLSVRENCADLICVPGPVHKQILDKYVDSEIIVSGMPKLDNLFSRNKFEKKSLGLDEDRKTILIAPTFNPEFSLMRFMNVKIIELLLKKYNLIFKFHGVENNELINQIKEFSKISKSCYLFEKHDITDVMKLSDMLISDVSSVIYEYLTLDRPIILFDSPYMKTHRKYSENDLEHKFRDVGVRINSIDILPQIIDNQFDNDEFKDKRKWVKRLFISNSKEKNSSKLIIDNILKMDDKKENACIVILKDDKQKFLNFKKRISKKFNIFFIDKKNDLLGFFSHCKNIIYIDANYNYSNLYEKFLYFGLRHNKSILFPLISSSITGNDQKIENFFPITQNLTNDQISSSITYQNPGVYIPINNFKPISFGIPGNYCSQFVNAKNFDDVISIMSELKKVVSLDTYVYED